MRRVTGPRMFWKQLPGFVLSFVLLHRAAESCVPAGASTDTLILCRTCGHELAFGTDINFVPSPLALSSRNDTSVSGRRIHVQVLKNPHGHRFEVVTFRKADVTKHWPADRDFSWFPGFSWTVATCPRCQTHLGWAFQPSDWPHTISKTTFEESKNTFVALITHRILREDFASSLLITPKSFKS
ncbi:protein cereblon homolog [Austrofundulus limnaeus]|uniref:Protein cereblon homolog n=1 Tax=Austrofundulus limnaeus TaxID=52670 RepID=A0A2I4BQN7_AUSLI|nr:PREDICTED: protein cereblon homolog [Austrofundulus limnaeus]